jgi:hypothetical protein
VGQIRTQAARDNEQSPARTKINGYCREGFVWREAGPDDHVCVTPETRAQVALDNQQAASRVAAQP